MTQAITNTKLNNLEKMLSNVEKTSKTTFDGTDKSLNDFKKVFDKTLDKNSDKSCINTNTDENTKSETTNEILDFEQVKESLNKEENSENWSEFKNLLTEISKEANIETSLDLTLAKDITEIIDQLKEAIESTDEIINATTSEEDFSLVLNQELNLEQELDLNSDTELNFEGSEDVDIDSENAIIKNESKIVFEQLLTSLNAISEGVVKKSELQEDNSNLNDKESETSLDLSLDSEEIINLVDNLPEETITQKTSESDNTEDFTLDEEVFKDLKIETIKADIDSTGNNDFMQNQTPEEIGVKVMINQDIEAFDVKIEQNVQPTQNTQQAQTKTVEIHPSRIIDQISKHLETLQNNSKISIILNPESLGKVDIQLLTTKEGLSAQFTVATQEARDLLMKGLDGLKETLTSHGVGVDNVSVKVAEGQKSEYKQDWTEQEGSKGGNKRQDQPNREEKEKGLFEKMMAQSQDEENGNV